MHKTLQSGWRFVRLPLDGTLAQARSAGPAPVDMPHDWLIWHADRLYEDGTGWYFYPLTITEQEAHKRIVLHFDGVYMDAEVLVNGEPVCAHRYGYTPFWADLTGRLTAGENELCVRVRYQAPNSRWYSGAGIFRAVTCYVTEPFALLPDGVRIDTVPGENGRWTADVRAEAVGAPDGSAVRCELISPQGEKVFDVSAPAGQDNHFVITVNCPAIWEPELPALYTLLLILNGDTVEKRIGFRTTRFDPDKGFFLNGRHRKLQGVCLHHDLGLLGAAFHRDAAKRQLDVMRRMGVNAVRTAHNPPAEEFLDLCDEMGMLVMDELYDMWEMSKTKYDNARFFPETWRQDVAAYVRRDRCHPSVILWSIGNEIQDMHVSARGQEWTKKLMDEVRVHDQVHAPVTFGSNYMPWEGAQRCADIVKLPGYNYAEKYYDEHHKKHPDWVIYGSETASMMQSRGIYHFPQAEPILAEEDLQCSELLNSKTSWGIQDLPGMLADDRVNPYTLGQFVWAGIDYIGEPTPYHTRNCYFGQTDTACFPKDSYFLYQAFWTDRPMIHIGGIWDWNDGQLIDVPVMTNASRCELFLNGRSLGVRDVCLEEGQRALPCWQVPYEKGTLRAVGYDKNGKVLCEEERTSFGDSVQLALSAEATPGAGHIAFITVTARDAEGKEVLNANDRVRVTVTGEGVLLGLDNGDSTDPDGYRTDVRRLFSGKLLIMAAVTGAGKITVRAESEGLAPAELSWDAAPGDGPSVLTALSACPKAALRPGRDIRRIALSAEETPIRLTREHPTQTVSFRVWPEGAVEQPLSFRIVNAQGVDVSYAQVRQQEGRVTLEGQGDGVFYLRATAANGEDHTRIISHLEGSAEGFGSVHLDPYGFISGSLSDVRGGSITAGNEKGIAFARDGWSMAGFTHVDFGPAGSDTLILPIFEQTSDPVEITLWDGVPDQGGEKIDVLIYQKPSIWNTYQEETYHLPRVLTGVHTLCFTMEQKIHLKGFRFEKQSRAWRGDRALNADDVYGDSFVRTEEALTRIGNNVTVRFAGLDFEEGGKIALYLDGLTRHEKDAVTLRVKNARGEETVETCMFQKTAAHEAQRFSLSVPAGECEVSFVFLPGSDFDFYSFRFAREKD